MSSRSLNEYPGGEIVEKGLEDLAHGIHSEEALLLLAAGPRLRVLGLEIRDPGGIERPFEHRLFELLEERLDRGAHSAYNALIGRLVSFADTYP